MTIFELASWANRGCGKKWLEYKTKIPQINQTHCPDIPDLTTKQSSRWPNHLELLWPEPPAKSVTASSTWLQAGPSSETSSLSSSRSLFHQTCSSCTNNLGRFIFVQKRLSFSTQFILMFVKLTSAPRYCSGHGSPQRPSHGARRLRLPPRQEGHRNGRSPWGFQGHFRFFNFLVSGWHNKNAKILKWRQLFFQSFLAPVALSTVKTFFCLDHVRRQCKFYTPGFPHPNTHSGHFLQKKCNNVLSSVMVSMVCLLYLNQSLFCYQSG